MRSDKSHAQRALLVARGVAPAAQSLAAAYCVLAADARLILQQPDLSLTILPTLPEDQALVRLHVHEYQSEPDLAAGILATFQSLATIGRQVVNMAGALLPTAAVLDTADPASAEYGQALATWRSTLAALSQATTSLDPDKHSAALPISACHDALAAFLRNQIADDVARFDTAVKSASQSGDIRSLALQITALQSQIDGLDQEIAKGATKDIVAAVKFGFTITSAVATATEAGPLLLDVGFALKDEAGKVSALGEQMQETNDELDGLIAEYEALITSLIDTAQEMAVLLTIQGDLGIFSGNLADARDAIEVVLGTTQQLAQGLARLEAVDVGYGPDWFTSQLRAGIAAWEAIGALVDADLRLLRSLG